MKKVCFMSRNDFLNKKGCGHYSDDRTPNLVLLLSRDEGEYMVKNCGGVFRNFRLLGECKTTGRIAFDAETYVTSHHADEQYKTGIKFLESPVKAGEL